MGNRVTVYKGDVVEIFEDVIGHNVGNGAIQILKMSGDNRIIFNPDLVDVELDDVGEKSFRDDYENRLQALAQEQSKTAKDSRPVEEQVKITPKLVPVSTQEH